MKKWSYLEEISLRRKLTNAKGKRRLQLFLLKNNLSTELYCDWFVIDIGQLLFSYV